MPRLSRELVAARTSFSSGHLTVNAGLLSLGAGFGLLAASNSRLLTAASRRPLAEPESGHSDV